MILFFNEVKYFRKQIERFVIALIILLFVTRGSFPVFKYPFILLFSVTLIYVLMVYWDRVKIKFKLFFTDYSIISFLFLFLCYGIFNSEKIFLLAFKEMANTVILIVLFIILNILIINIKELKLFTANLIYLLIYIAFFIAAHDFINLFNIIEPETYSQIDYNFSLLPIFIGIIGILHQLLKTKSIFIKLFYNLLLLLFTFNILFSSSRRGIIILIIIYIVIVVLQFYSFFSRSLILKNITIKTRFYVISVLFVNILLYFFIYNTSYKFKNNCLESLGSKNILNVKKGITRNLLRYSTILNKKYSYSGFYRLLWTNGFNSLDPESGWGFENCKLVFPLIGENVNIIPVGSIGCIVDSSYYLHLDPSIEKIDSYSLIDEIEVKKGERYKASVFCYASNDFRQGQVSIAVGWDAVNEKIVSSQSVGYYDLKKAGSWQKLKIEFTAIKDGEIPIYLSIYEIEDFSKKNDHVIFAYPSYNKLEFNSLDPERGWGFNNCKLIFPLSGKNSDIVPSESVGCMIDSTCYQHLGPSIGNIDSYSLIDKIEVKKGERYKASVFCYTSNDFRQGQVSIAVGWAAVNEKIVSSQSVGYSDLKKAGSWQELKIEFTAINDGEIPIYLSIYGIEDYSKMNGHVIFAYPSYSKIESNKSSLLLIKLNKEMNCINIFNNVNENYVKLDSCNSENIIKSSFLNEVFFYGIWNNNILPEDPIRKLAAKIISEDTTYHNYNADIVIDTVVSGFSGPRIMRWQFAWEIFTKEYNWKKIFFGGGFDFLNWYGYFFFHDKTRSDYPHNPFLHILLYSGIIGLLLYILLLYKVFYYYIKYIKEYYLFFIFFLITYFFTFFSGGSPFDPPIMGFFMLLPFFINYIHQKEEKESIKEKV